MQVLRNLTRASKHILQVPSEEDGRVEIENTHSVSNYRPFDPFNSKFDRSSDSKKLCKYSQI